MIEIKDPKNIKDIPVFNTSTLTRFTVIFRKAQGAINMHIPPAGFDNIWSAAADLWITQNIFLEVDRLENCTVFPVYKIHHGEKEQDEDNIIYIGYFRGNSEDGDMEREQKCREALVSVVSQVMANVQAYTASIIFDTVESLDVINSYR